MRRLLARLRSGRRRPNCTITVRSDRLPAPRRPEIPGRPCRLACHANPLRSRRQRPRQGDRTRASDGATLSERGAYATVAKIAAAANVNASYVGRILRLTLLAPDICGGVLGVSNLWLLPPDELMGSLSVEWRGRRRSVSIISSRRTEACRTHTGPWYSLNQSPRSIDIARDRRRVVSHAAKRIYPLHDPS